MDCEVRLWSRTEDETDRSEKLLRGGAPLEERDIALGDGGAHFIDSITHGCVDRRSRLYNRSRTVLPLDVGNNAVDHRRIPVEKIGSLDDKHHAELSEQLLERQRA